MISFAPGVKIYLHRQPIYMRKSLDCLFAFVQYVLAMVVRFCGLFLFNILFH